MNQSFYVKTYGCQMNEYDSEKIDELLIHKGFKKAKNFGVYANSRKLKKQKSIQDLGKTEDIDVNHYANTVPISSEEYAKEAKIWIDQGAYVVGGCCTTRPEHIKRIADERTQHPPRSESVNG